MRSLIDILDFSVEELQDLLDTAMDIISFPEKYENLCRRKKLATLFYEPSTRTRLSFTAAMMELGGNVLGFSQAASSSVSKGESVADTARIVSNYADIIAIRHPLEGASLVASLHANIPVINAGDGAHSHPTQTLADLLTIYRTKGRLDHLKIGLCGDLIYGRTVHSLIRCMSRYPGNEFVLISPKELSLPDYIKKNVLDHQGVDYQEEISLDKALMKGLDILYMTRIQKERFDQPDQYERLKDSYVLNEEKMKRANQDMYVLHPLPRVNEISVDVDDDHRAVYFDQALNGKYMRMALILYLLNEAKKNPLKIGEKRIVGKPADFHCVNPKCIGTKEQELEARFYEDDFGQIRCAYCESKAEEGKN